MIVCALGAATVSFYFILRRTDLFNQFNESFEDKPLMRYQALIFYCVRFTMGLFIGVLVNFHYAWIVVFCLQLVHIFYIIVKRPYVEKKMMVASVSNESAAIVFIVMTLNAHSGV
jgi:hypothetical protein